MTPRRVIVALCASLAVLPVAGLRASASPAGPAVPPAPAASPTSETSPTSPTSRTSVSSSPSPRRDLADDVVRPAGRAGAAGRIRRWPGRTITYYESIPAKWDWSLDRALAHWNESGGKIRFVEVAKKKKARLVISYGKTGGADGLATLGYSRKNFVRLSPTYKRVDETDPEQRVWVGRLLAHELGHVLGFQHTSARCSLMVPVLDLSACPVLASDRPGYYPCRWIDAPLLKRFVQMYGGRAKQPPALCLIEELPGALRDVAFSGGGSSGPVQATWKPPARANPGTVVRVTTWNKACSTTPPKRAEVFEVRPSAGTWTDPGYGRGTWCYRVEIVNRYGGGRPPVAQEVARYRLVPAAPAVTRSWSAADGGWRLRWTPPQEGMELVVVRDWDDPSSCLPAYDEEFSDWLDQVSPGVWLLYASAPTECVTAHVLTEWGTVSPGTQLQLTAPAPATPALGSSSWVAADESHRVSWTPPDEFTYLQAVRGELGASTCPTAPYDPDVAEWLDQDSSGRWIVPLYADGECVTFYAVTDWGSVSAGTTRALARPGAGDGEPGVGDPGDGDPGDGDPGDGDPGDGDPDGYSGNPAVTVTPEVGTISRYVEDGWAAAATITWPADLPDDSELVIGVEVLEGACPATLPADLWFDDGFDDPERPGVWFFYPEPELSEEPQCLLVTALDDEWRHGPVVARTFTLTAPVDV